MMKEPGYSVDIDTCSNHELRRMLWDIIDRLNSIEKAVNPISYKHREQMKNFRRKRDD